jgi:dTDP-4-amino-4,6-dideoxygalactose transaminase
MGRQVTSTPPAPVARGLHKGMAITPAPVPTLTTIRPVAFAPPDLGPDEMDEVRATLASGWLSTGPRVHQFEREFGAYVGAPHAVAVNSCTAALHLALIAAETTPAHEVVTTPLTFCATANVIVHVGARPVFADVDPRTWNLDPEAVAGVLSPRTKAIIPVHYAGRPADMRAFEALAKPAGIVLIEDAAHCIEGVAAGRKVGGISEFTCFSFYATKNITTGEGGMLTTADGAAAARIRMASLHGMDRDAWSRYAPGATSRRYEVHMAGYKYNMMDLQAAIGLHQLRRIQTMHARRAAIAARYDAALADLPLQRPARPAEGMVHAHHLYPVLVNPRVAGLSRDVLQERLSTRGIATSVHFPALHLHPFYQERFGFRRGMFPVAETISDQTLSLPLASALSDEDVGRVIDAVHECLS